MASAGSNRRLDLKFVSFLINIPPPLLRGGPLIHLPRYIEVRFLKVAPNFPSSGRDPLHDNRFQFVNLAHFRRTKNSIRPHASTWNFFVESTPSLPRPTSFSERSLHISFASSIASTYLVRCDTNNTAYSAIAGRSPLPPHSGRFVSFSSHHSSIAIPTTCSPLCQLKTINSP